MMVHSVTTNVQLKMQTVDQATSVKILIYNKFSVEQQILAKQEMVHLNTA